ncbi:hypothetical protein M378DRAFT_158497 [Amanita muscaria Koide BX008]|uniref:Bifunctional polynucleotide phosphatase/kinase n=1 Tax=Amanita muscaria (strain Koide BX008) TaxID=946122 RepID=A0A0C2XI53_AMAMK|nr:hypothetical protein M378DRAFT_158497 [Amanita muscaria Koide BX008]
MEGSSHSHGVKRAVSPEQAEVQRPKKAVKIHPFFEKPQKNISDDNFEWLKPFGETRSCLHGINLQPTSSPRIAAFDLDGTIIKSELRNTAEWEWWRSDVPKKLKEAHEAGYAIVIISNQAINSLALKKWKQKIPSIAAALSELPFRLFAATAKDWYRKPMPGMWYELERIFRADGIEIDKTASFFVGDAAGRQFTKKKADFASTDRKWALNIDVKFYTPEEYFLGLTPHRDIVLPGFHVSSLPDLPLFVPTSKPLIPPGSEQEIVLFVGYPCLGKTTFFRRVFEPASYVHINQDNLKNRNKCITAVRDAMQNKLSCVVDNTNRDRATRKAYIDLAREFCVTIRCFVFTGSIELAWHNNLYRAFNIPPSATGKEPPRKLLPYSAFASFLDKYDEPSEDEGYTEIKKINWVFQGTEQERKHWSMWLQIDGK